MYKLPDIGLITAKGKIPAIVLVHGRGGMAFKEWVDKWNDAEFAAILVAVEGQTVMRVVKLEKAKTIDSFQWQTHLNSSTSRKGIYGDFDIPVKDQWMFHALSAVIRAKHFLASQQEIDKQHIGLT